MGPGRARVSITDHEDGVATVRYTCSCSGRHHVMVRLGEEQLAGFPFEVHVDVATRAGSAPGWLLRVLYPFRFFYIHFAYG